jgi:hypothetical protein
MGRNKRAYQMKQQIINIAILICYSAALYMLAFLTGYQA